MITGSEYMLFLQYSGFDQWYIPIGVNYGKVPLDTTEKLITKSDDTEFNTVNSIIQSTRNKYNFNEKSH